MTWRGTNHIHCHTQMKKIKKIKQLSHHLCSRARSHVQQPQITYCPPPRGPKQTGAEENGCCHWVGMDARCGRWCWCTAPLPQAGNSTGHVSFHLDIVQPWAAGIPNKPCSSSPCAFKNTFWDSRKTNHVAWWRLHHLTRHDATDKDYSDTGTSFKIACEDQKAERWCL